MFRMRFWILFFCFSLQLLLSAEKKTVCLNMFVKDESHVVKKCLESIKPYIDYWVIVDTGSQDDTKAVIRETMKGIPGELLEWKWNNIEETGNRALDIARTKGDYVLFMTPEDWLEYAPGFQWPHLSEDVYCITSRSKTSSYIRRQVIKASLPWHWRSEASEYLACDTPCTSVVLEGVSNIVGQVPPKELPQWREKIEVLKKVLQNEPENARAVLYLAESYRGAGEREKALEWYKKRTLIGQEEQEVFWALLQSAIVKQELSCSLDEVIDSYYQAYRFRPHRIEPIYHLAHLYNRLNQYLLAYETIKMRSFIRQPVEKDKIGGSPWMEEYGLPFELAISSFSIGKYQESLDVCDALLALDTLPAQIRKQVVLQKNSALRELELLRVQGKSQ